MQRADVAGAAAADKAAAAEEAQRHVETRVADAQQAAADAADELKIKKILLDNAGEQVAELKVELEEAMQCAPALTSLGVTTACAFRFSRPVSLICLFNRKGSKRGKPFRGTSAKDLETSTCIRMAQPHHHSNLSQRF